MGTEVIAARIRGFICLNAHPAGCAANVDAEIAVAEKGAGGPGAGIGAALVIGGSTGYGLSSRGEHGLRLRRARHGGLPGAPAARGQDRVGRLVQPGGRPAPRAGRRARHLRRQRRCLQPRDQDLTIAQLKKTGQKLDSVVYSLAAPKRLDPADGVSYSSVLKPIGAPFASKSINLGNGQVTAVEIAPASDAEIEATRKVMGGEDFAAWLRGLADADLLGRGCRAVAYSYIGPALTFPIYRSGTIGKAKEDLERTTTEMSALLAARVGGAAFVSVNKALVTQASSAIPVVPLYISLLYKVMKERGTHEGTAEQIARLYRDHLGPGRQPQLDAAGRIRLDDLELDPGVQARVDELWAEVTTENLASVSDYAGFRTDFRKLFGFEVPGVDYDVPVEIDVPIAT